MSNPPVDTSPSELFVKLTSRVRPHRVVDLPRNDEEGNPVGRVAIVTLTQAEVVSAAAESEKKARKALEGGLPKKEEASMGYSDVYGNLAACEILFRACKSVDDPTLKKSAFKTPHEISSAFSSEEIGVLHHHYETVRAETGPIVSTMTDDEIDAWVKVLAEGGTAIPLDSLSWHALTTLLLSMASRLASSQTDNSSPGSPADQPTDTEGSSESSGPSAT